MPASARIRVEVYIPDRPGDPSYRTTLDWIADEFTYLRAGGASTIEHIDGRYLSPRTGMSIHERVSLATIQIGASATTSSARKSERSEEEYGGQVICLLQWTKDK